MDAEASGANNNADTVGNNDEFSAANILANLPDSEPLSKKAKINEPFLPPNEVSDAQLPDSGAPDSAMDAQLEETQTILSTLVEPPSACHSVIGTEDSKTLLSQPGGGPGSSSVKEGMIVGDALLSNKEDDDAPVYLGSVFDQSRSQLLSATMEGEGIRDDGGNNGTGQSDNESDIEIVFEQPNLDMAARRSVLQVDQSKIRINLTHFQQARKRLCEILENYRRLEAVGLDNLLVLLPTCLPMLLNVVKQVTPVERMERLLSLQAVQPFGEEEQKCILVYLYENFHEFHEGNRTFANYIEMILMPELTVRLYALVNHISVEQAENEMFKILGVIHYGFNTPWMSTESEENSPYAAVNEQVEDPLLPDAMENTAEENLEDSAANPITPNGHTYTAPFELPVTLPENIDDYATLSD